MQRAESERLDDCTWGGVGGTSVEFVHTLGHLFQEFREREINNGRFAMFAAIGILAAELYTGKDAIEQFGL